MAKKKSLSLIIDQKMPKKYKKLFLFELVRQLVRQSEKLVEMQ